MRFSAVVAFLGAAASVSASAIVSRQGALPDCATTCLTTAPPGDCTLTDNACLCRNEAFITAATTCITTTCQGEDLATALTVAQAMCANEGVTLGAPGATTTTTGTGAPATTTGASTSAPTNTAPSTTTSGSNPAQTTSGAMSRGLSSVAALAAIALAAVSL